MDILSGSYSHMERKIPMAGWFQVLWGMPQGKFAAPTPLNNLEGSPLTVKGTERVDLARICTRPTAVDLNGDGHLDIVSGNFGGTFYVFYGQGQAKYPVEGEWLKAGGETMEVPNHSDPFFVDWDGDGDQDLLSGSAAGGVYLFTNNGDRNKASFAKPVQLIEASISEDMQFGMEHLTGSQTSSRIWVADMNDDGKLDILVGDGTTLSFPAEGLTESEARAQYAAWEKEGASVAEAVEASSNSQEDSSALWNAYYKKMDQIVTQEMTGFVWVYYQK